MTIITASAVAHAERTAPPGPWGQLRSIHAACIEIDSPDRIVTLLDVIADVPDPVFWRAFRSVWPSCDRTWPMRGILLRTLRSRQATRARPIRGLDRLPNPIVAYRGCASAEMDGLSWSLERKVAASFAQGHRQIRNLDPVIVSAIVPRSAIFARIDARTEAEFVLDPAMISALSIEPAP